MNLLQVNDLSVSYGHAAVLHDVHMDVKEGEIVAVIGANGAGKTTLLKALTGLLKPKSGTITYKNMPITGSPVHNIMRLGIAYVPQGRQVFVDKSVKDNLILGAYASRKDKRKVKQLLEREYERFPRLKERRN